MPMTTSSPYTQQDTIDRYLLGEMTPDEERDFKSRMDADPALNDEVGLMRRIMAAISLRASRDERMARWDREADAASASRTSATPLFKKSLPYLSAAASAVVIFMLGGYLLNPGHSGITPGDVPVEKSEGPAPSILTTGMRGSVEASVATIGRELYESRETASFALTQIDNALADTIIEPGISMEEAEYQRTLIARRSYDLRWLRINALIAAGQISKAREELVAFSTEEGYYRDEAQALLKQFE
jgi:hypothetical protein